MTLEPRPAPRPASEEVRAAARRQAERAPASLVVVAAMGAAALLMLMIVLLDYTFAQDPHRVVKVVAGLAAVGSILAVPHVGLLLFPVVSPFLPWIPPTPVPGLNTLNVLLFSIFAAFALGRVMQRRPFVRRGRASAALGWLLLVCGLSIVRGAAIPTGFMYDPRATALELFRSAATFAPYFIVLAMVTGRAARRRVAWAVVVGLLAEAVVTVLLGRSGRGARALGSIGQANELGAFFALFGVVSLALLPGVRSWLGRAALLAAFALGGFGVLLSVSRAGLLAMVAGLVVVAARTSRALLVVLVVVLAAAPLWLPDYVMDRITHSEVQTEGSDEASLDLAAEARVETWQSILALVRDHALDGVGFAGLGYVLPDIGTELGLDEVKDSSHNTYLRMLGETGVVGFGVFLWLLWTLWRLADAGVRRARDRFDRALAVGLCGAVVALAVSCAFGDRFWNVCITGGFWMLCALVDDQLLVESPAPADARRAPAAAAAPMLAPPAPPGARP